MARAFRCFVIACLLAPVVLSGCAAGSPHNMSTTWLYPHAIMQTAGEAPDDHHYRVSRILSLDTRLLADDLDLLFMTDRSTRLSRWHDR